MPSYNETWDETKPAGTRDRSLGDDDIREFKTAIRERLAQDHDFVADETGENFIGYHKKVTVKLRSGDETKVTDAFVLYCKSDGSTDELFGIDESGNIIQITKAGELNVDVVQDGAVMESSAAPSADAGVANKKYVDDQVATKGKFAIITGTWSMDDASGSVSLTGAGFTPTSVELIATQEASDSQSHGHDDGTTAKCVYAPNGGSSWDIDGSNSIRLEAGASDRQTAKVSAMTADGCTLANTKVGSPAAGTVSVIAICRT